MKDYFTAVQIKKFENHQCASNVL